MCFFIKQFFKGLKFSYNNCPLFTILMIKSLVRHFNRMLIKIKRCEDFNFRIKKKLQWRFVDLPNQEMVNPSQSDEIFKDISKNGISNKIVKNKGLNAL